MGSVLEYRGTRASRENSIREITVFKYISVKMSGLLRGELKKREGVLRKSQGIKELGRGGGKGEG